MRMLFSLLLTALLSSTADAADNKKAALIRTHGYVSPQFQAVWRPDARPVDQSRVGMTKSKAGIIFDGRVSAHWGFKIHFVVGGDTFKALTHARPVDENNDGSTDSVHTESEEAMGDMVVESTVTYKPVSALQVQLGRMRIPFTSQAQSPNTDLMFPERSGPNQAFVKGSDMGGLIKTNLFEGRMKGSVGVFNGTSTNALKTSRQGVLYTGRIDVNPLGDFGFSETSEWAGPFLVGLGAGAGARRSSSGGTSQQQEPHRPHPSRQRGCGWGCLTQPLEPLRPRCGGNAASAAAAASGGSRRIYAGASDAPGCETLLGTQLGGQRGVPHAATPLARSSRSHTAAAE